MLEVRTGGDLIRRKLRTRDCHLDRMTLSTPYSNEFREIRDTITKHLPVLYADETWANIVQEGWVLSMQCPTEPLP